MFFLPSSLPSFLFLFNDVLSVSPSLLPIYYCLPVFSDTTWHESNYHPPSINHQSTRYSHYLLLQYRYLFTSIYSELLFIGKEMTMNMAANRLVTKLPPGSTEMALRNIKTFFRTGSYTISLGGVHVEYVLLCSIDLPLFLLWYLCLSLSLDLLLPACIL